MDAFASPLLRWHARHVLLLWIVVRIAIAAVLGAGSGIPGMPPAPFREHLLGPTAAFGTCVLTLLLSAIDRHRVGASMIFGNLGISWQWLVTSSLAYCAALEVILQLIARTAFRLTGQPA
jgi:hypothetical protein